MKHSFLTIIVILIISLVPLKLSAYSSSHVTSFSKKELKTIQGHYSTIYGYLKINVKGRYVSTNFDGKHIQLMKKSNGHFYPKYKLLRIFPINLGDMSFSMKKIKGKNQILMHENNKRTKVVAQKFEATAVPKVWKQRLGKYKASLIKGRSKIKQIRLAIKNSVLVAYINKISNPYPLLALSGTKIYSPSAGHNSNQDISISSNKNRLNLIYGKNSLMLKKH